MAICRRGTPSRSRAASSPTGSGLQASGTKARPMRAAKGRTRFAVLLETMVRLTPAARMASTLR